jgi:hypothetical protein
MTSRKALVYAAAGVLLFSGAMVVADPAGVSLRGWSAYLVVSAIGATALGLAWSWLTAGNGPRWLLICVLVGLLMRAGVAVALARGLPLFGYDEKVQRAGYVFFDAYKRDTDAWAVAKSDRSLWLGLTEPRSTDQYGGMLFVSSVVYRMLSPDVHRPVLISIMTAFASTLGILFGWAFALKVFGSKASAFTAWAMAIYPESVLLASSQMREPFVMSSIAGALFGYALLREGMRGAGVATILVAGASVLLISPPYAILTLAVAVLAGLWEGRLGWRRTWLVALPILALAALGLLLLVQAWTGLRYIWGEPLQALVRWWQNAGEQWRLNLLDEQSGWISIFFNVLPQWAQLPFVVFYGVIQPLLPAAIAYPGAAIWRAIAIWRSLGWYVLLPFIAYAPFPAFRKGNRRGLQAYLAALVWVGAVVAAYRATSYQWDSPRYRAVFLIAQVALAAWALEHVRRSRSPWLVRSAVLIGIPTLGLLVWYLGRYYDLVSLSLYTGMGASLVIDAALIVWWAIRGSGAAGLPSGSDARPS